LTSNDPRHRRWFMFYGVVGFLLVCAQGYYLHQDDKDKSGTIDSLKGAVKNLQEQTAALMNAIRLQATLDDFRHLEGVIVNGFAHLEAVIQGKKQPFRPPEQTQSLPPAVVEHVRIIQRRAASDKSDAPFGLQVIMQTDVPIQPVAFRVEFDHEISDGEAFIVGEGAYTSMTTGFSNDRKAFLFSFHTPAFTPNSSLVVSVQSKFDVRVTKVEKIQPLI